MSAKYAKKKKRGIKGLVVAVVLLAILVAVMLLMVWKQPDPAEIPTTEPTAAADAQEQSSGESAMQTIAPAENTEPAKFELGRGMVLLEVNKYTGIYMEDGTDEVVADVLMLIVSNEGDQDIQYAEFTVPTSAGDAKFSLSTLPVGEKIVLLEQNRMPWSADEDYSNVTAENIAVFSEPVSLREDQLKLQALDGVINITNISGEDITGDIVIYYKNAAVDLLYGGITYRIRLEGGLKANEIRQIMASHFTQSGSRIMFATVG